MATIPVWAQDRGRPGSAPWGSPANLSVPWFSPLWGVGREGRYVDNTTDNAEFDSPRSRALVGCRSRFFTVKMELVQESKVKTDVNGHRIEK